MEEFRWKKEHFIECFNLSCNHEKIKINQNKIESTISERIYIDINQETDFSVEEEHDYRFYLDADLDDVSKAYLAVTGYENNEKKEVFFTPFNQNLVLKFNSNVDCIKLLIRIDEEGIFKLNYLQIDKKKSVDFFELKKVKKILNHEGVPYKDIKIALISDKFTEICLKEEMQVISFNPENWKLILPFNVPHLLFVESTWNGKENSWYKKVACVEKNQLKFLEEVVNWCKKNEIPTVFWNKEDPIHFSTFIEAAKLFDYVFTTDENMIPLYKRILKKEDVYSLPFAAQPKIHNPIVGKKLRKNKCFFAGTYHKNRYQNRKDEIETLFDVAKSFGLDIYDRNHNKEGNHFEYPESYHPLIKGSIPYEQIMDIYKEYRVGINVNSVNDSNTMFSRRVFEILACNTPVVSSESKGIQHYFHDIIVSSNKKEALMNELNQLFYDQWYYRKKALFGLREVFSKHTYRKRMELVLSKLNLNIIDEPVNITFIAYLKTQLEYYQLLDIIEKQSLCPHDVIILSKGHIKTDDGYKKYVLEDYENKTLKDIINTNYVSMINPQYFYGKNYLYDLYLATHYTDASFITKPLLNNEYQYTENVRLYGSLINKCVYHQFFIKDLLCHKKFNNRISDLIKKGFQAVAIDYFNYQEYYDAKIKKIEI